MSLSKKEILNYYSRKDVQKELLFAAKNREVGIRYGENGFGKRPDMLQFGGDILDAAKSGATSFHLSEEHWKDPLAIKTGMNKKQLDELRIGFDVIIDIDSKFLEYSKITAELILETLKFYGLQNIGLKFSGNRSFHIGIPFKAFPKKVNNIQTNSLFPETPRIIASYIKEQIGERLTAEILKLSNIREIAKSVGKEERELLENNLFNPYSIIEIDTILISSRHLYRAPYSLNEKSDLMSTPIKISQLKDFKLSQAKSENVITGIKFLDEDAKGGEATELIIQAFEWYSKNNKREEKNPIITPNIANVSKIPVKEDYFPPCIKLLVNGVQKDGRKRGVFILTNFLFNMNWDIKKIEEFILEWNKKNYEPLREGYIKSQINWFSRQKQSKMPPNCDNEAYYKDIGICQPDNLCKLIKNPVNYSLRKIKFKKVN